MKKLITLVVVMMALGANVVAQNITYELGSKGSLRITNTKEETFTNLRLEFEKSVPDSIKTNQHVLKTLIQEKEYQLSVRHLYGKKDAIILYYTPKALVSALYYKDGRISYKMNSLKVGEKVFAWWYVFSFLALIFAFVVRKRHEESTWWLFVTLFINSIAFLIFYSSFEEVKRYYSVASDYFTIILAAFFFCVMSCVVFLILIPIIDEKRMVYFSYFIILATAIGFYLN